MPEGSDAVHTLAEELAHRIVLDSARGRALQGTKGAGTSRWKAFRSLTEAMELWGADGFKHSDEEMVERVDRKLAEAVEEDPEYALAHFNRGILWLRTLRDAETNARARDHLLEAHRLAREQARKESLTTVHVDRRVEGLAALGVARTYSQDRHRFGRMDIETVRKAREAAAEAVGCLPDDPDALYAQAFAFHCTETLEDIEAAIPLYRKIIGKKPGRHPGAHNNLGYIYMVAGQHLRERGGGEKARKYWARAEKEMRLTLKHSDPRSRTIEFAHANLGNLYRLQGRYEDAESHYLQALGPNPESSRYTNGLNEYALLLLESGRREEGMEFHRRAMATIRDPGQREKLKRDVAPFLQEEPPDTP
jgi:tetratricopeptide (TPR) repeat protein